MVIIFLGDIYYEYLGLGGTFIRNELEVRVKSCIRLAEMLLFRHFYGKFIYYYLAVFPPVIFRNN